MADARNIATVAAEVVLEIPERYDGYRESLVRQLLEILRRQDSDAGTTTRRAEMRRLIEAFSATVTVSAEGDATRNSSQPISRTSSSSRTCS